ncbi:MAG: protein kinase [Endomicrobia bacterium]|nr:protein kinase [Endomicrobiia bacterium]
MDEKKSPGGLDLGLFINDQYVTVKKIGQGGFGVVWQAYDFSLRNFIAVKELLSEYSEPKFVEMFYKEALIAKNIIHDNVVRVQHFWKGSNGSFYISMDFVRGVDLEDLVRRCNELKIKIPWELSVLICISMLKAIDYANRVARDSITGKPYGIVYRDISPGNILISFDGNVKLSDFGIAKTADEINEGMQQKVVTGKFPYMSPEQIKGIADIDHRSDVFSTGVVFYEMLTGKQLYTGENSEIKSQVLNQKFDTELLAGLNLPYEIGEILSKSLEKDRETRYERAIEMYRDLRRLLKGVETEELAVDLSSFISKVMEKELTTSDNIVNLVKTLDRQDIKSNAAIPRITCNDFIAGEVTEHSAAPVVPPSAAAVAAAGAASVPVQNTAAGAVPPQPPPAAQPNIAKPETPQPQAVPQAGAPQSPEAKGKTVFEEVGDWLVNKFKALKSKIIKTAIAVILAVLLFFVLDVFVMQLTPLGKDIYARLYPPDVTINTVPSGATVSMKTKEGEVIIQNTSSSNPIQLRKVQPGTYIITALKEGFRPVQRVVRIEERTGNKNKAKQEKIEIMFDFLLAVNSEPQGADVYIDGNKFGVTPCKIQLMAGAHTIRLSLAGFEDLGSKAKEAKEGQADIDFTRPTKEEMFAGVDKNFWETDLVNIDGENVFSMKGYLFKKFAFTSTPPKMMVHIEGEGQPRGYTPLTVNMKAGNYKVRMMDPEGRYGEALNQMTVSATSSSELFVHMNKLISFRVRSKGNAAESFIAKLTIQGKEFNTTKSVGTGKPVIVPLPSGRYNFTFTADDFNPYHVNDSDIANINSVTAEMTYAPVPLTLTVVSMLGDTETPIEGMYVQRGDSTDVIGKTNAKGVWTSKFDPGVFKGKIISKDSYYIEQSFEVTLAPGTGGSKKVIMVPTAPPEPAIDTTTPVFPFSSDDPKKKKPPTTPPAQPEKPAVTPPKGGATIIVCPFCGYINTVPDGRRLRFCVNCAKPLPKQ